MKRPQRLCPWGCGKLVAIDTSKRRYWHNGPDGSGCRGSRRLIGHISSERTRDGFLCVCDPCADLAFFPYASGGVGTPEFRAWVDVHFHHPKRSSSPSYESSES